MYYSSTTQTCTLRSCAALSVGGAVNLSATLRCVWRWVRCVWLSRSSKRAACALRVGVTLNQLQYIPPVSDRTHPHSLTYCSGQEEAVRRLAVLQSVGLGSFSPTRCYNEAAPVMQDGYSISRAFRCGLTLVSEREPASPAVAVCCPMMLS